MSAATSCSDLADTLFTLEAIALVCLAQAVDLRGRRLTGTLSRQVYETVRSAVPFVERDKPLDQGIAALRGKLKRMANEYGGLFRDEEA